MSTRDIDAATTSSPVRGKHSVLFLHGMEAGVNGRKVVELRRAGCDVHAVQMPCSRLRILLDPLMLCAIAVVPGITYACGSAFGLKGSLLCVIGVLVLLLPFGHLLVRRMVRRCVAVQERAIREAKQPLDIAVGSSFGGAVLVELMGEWE